MVDRGKVVLEGDWGLGMRVFIGGVGLGEDGDGDEWGG